MDRLRDEVRLSQQARAEADAAGRGSLAERQAAALDRERERMDHSRARDEREGLMSSLAKVSEQQREIESLRLVMLEKDKDLKALGAEVLHWRAEAVSERQLREASATDLQREQIISELNAQLAGLKKKNRALHEEKTTFEREREETKVSYQLLFILLLFICYIFYRSNKT